MAQKTAKPTKVIVMWSSRERLKDGNVSTLEDYNGTRIYEKDKVDGRLLADDGPLPYFDNIEGAVAYMSENPGKPVQFELGMAKRCKLLT